MSGVTQTVEPTSEVEPEELTDDQVEDQFGEGEGESEPEGEEEGSEGEEQPDPYASAPEFWSAERKALWEKIADPALRQALHEIDNERLTTTNKKIEEAALGRKDIEAKLQTYERERDELVSWWKDTAPRLGQAFQNKWAKVDWAKLAADNPAEYVKLNAEAQADLALLQQAAERNQREIDGANKRAEAALGERKRGEHAKLAEQFPDHFGADKAQKTYDDIRDYLLAQGTPADRIPHIYESFVVGTALKAMLYDKAKAEAAARRTAPKQQQPTTATQTPRRIAPGPARQAGNRQGDATRQAEQRLRTGQTLSDQDVAELFG